MKNFLACHQMHAKATLNDDRTRMIYRERKTRRLHFDQVLSLSIHHFDQVLDFLLIRESFSDFFIQIKNFLACHQMHVKGTLSNNRTRVIYREKEARRLHFDQVLNFSIHHFDQVFDFFLIKESFSDFFIQMKIFFACHQMHAKATFINNRRYYRK
jgi:hypothetical protein